MFTGYIGCSAISVSFLVRDVVGRDQVLCVLKGSCFLFIPMQWLFAMLSSSEIGGLGCIVVVSASVYVHQTIALWFGECRNTMAWWRFRTRLEWRRRTRVRRKAR